MAFKTRAILILLCLFGNKTHASILFRHDHYTEQSLATFIDCVQTLKPIFFDKTVMLSNEVQTNYFAEKLIKALDMSVTLVNVNSVPLKGTKYIVFSSNILFYKTFLNTFSTESKTFFTIIWTWSNFTIPKGTLEEVFSVFWSRRMINHMVLIEDSNHNINFYSQFPFRPNQCGKAGPPIHVDTWNSLTKDFTKGFFSSFMGLLGNFHGCPLRVLNKNRPPETCTLIENGTARLGGIGGKILSALMQKYNFTIIITQAEDLEIGAYVRDKHGYVLSNHSKNKVVEGLKDDKFDLAFGVFPFVAYFSSGIEFSFFYLIENYAFYVPCGTEENPSLWRFYYVEFSSPIWAVVVLLFVIFSCFMKILSKLLSEESTSFSSFWRNTFIFWAIHIENSAVFRTRSTTAKSFLTMVMFYSMIISVAYKSSLKSFLMAHVETKSIETWKELEESDFKVAGLAQDLSVLETIGATHPTLRKLTRKYIVISTGQFSDIVYDLAVKRNTAFFGSERMLMYYYSSLQEEFGTTIQKVCQVDQFVSSSPASSFLVRSGSPFRYMVDQLTIKEIQTGHMTFTGSVAAKTTTAFSLNEKQEPFSLQHLKGTFFMWFIGIITALAVLVIEVLHFKLHPGRITMM